MDEDAMNADEERMQEEEQQDKPKKVYIPGISRPLKDGEELDYDPDAYRVFHTFETTRPCLSFDIVHDNLGDKRSTFPLTCYLVAGTQADKARDNELILMRLSNMHAIEKDEVEDEESDNDDEDDEDAEKAKAPRLHAAIIPHHGDVNRVKCETIGPSEVVAVWNAQGKVQIWNLSNAITEADAMEDAPSKSTTLYKEKPLYSFVGHNAEGYSLAWSPLKTGTLASGDKRNKIYIWTMGEGGQWVVDQRPLSGHTGWVEDVQWSHTEESLLVSCSSDRSIRLWDTRSPPTQACVCAVENAHENDVNVISWNKFDPLLVSGGDDALLNVWSLKTIQYKEPVARFKHHKAPITSVEWSPTESTTFMASGEDDQTTIWDLAMETENGQDDLPDVPPQLLFVHMGQKEVKEVHWHRQIPGLAVNTSLSGFHIFRTCNV